jgi:MoxR-like ATPase
VNTAKALAKVHEATAQLLPPLPESGAKKSLSELRKALAIRAKTLDALEWLVDNAATYVDTATKFGMSPGGLAQAMDRPGVRDYLDARCDANLMQLRSRAVAKVQHLMDGRSEYVQLEAARTVLAETKKSEQGVAGNVTIEIVL